VVAGVLLEQIPARAQRTLRFPGLVSATSVLLIVGALGLVAGPWLGMMPVLMPGLVLYVVGTVLLLANLIGSAGPSRRWSPSTAHLLVAYLWMVVPVVVAPAVFISTGELPSGAIEAAAITGLIAGWLLQIVVGVLPGWVSGRIPTGRERRDGRWFSVVVINVGVAAIWISPFVGAAEGSSALTTAGYVLLVAGALRPLWEILNRLGMPAEAVSP
jgi:hypothetical protein